MIPPEIAPKPEFHALRPVIMTTDGLVVAGTAFAARAGASALAQGGSAADAAVSAAAVQAVVMPHMNGLGGDLFLLYRPAAGPVYALNASGPAPRRATIEAFRARGLKEVPARGIESVSVPGAVDGWFRTLTRFGRLSPAQVLEPAVAYAQEGFPLYKNFVRFLGSAPFQALKKGYPALGDAYLREGELPRFGERWAQPQLAATLQRIAEGGPEEFYRGETARLIAAVSGRYGGFLDREDLAGFQSEWVEPISVAYGGLTVYQLPPNSQGITMLQQLRAIEPFDLAALGHNSPAYVHLLTEAKKVAFHDRARHVADPRFAEVPITDLLSEERAHGFRQGFDPRRAQGSRVDSTAPSDGDTTCVIAADAEGNVAALIQSNFDEFGSGILVEGAGFVLHDRMCGFSLEPAHPNALAPGKRPMHTLCSSLVERDGRLYLAVETPGGHAQTQSLVQILNNIAVFGMDVQEAVEAPRFTHEGDQLLLERRFPDATRTGLEERGHTVEFIPSWSSIAGGSAAVTIDHLSGVRMGGADPRRDSYVIPV
jgi:gamma-glutamyltranspeptidase / glutathione hydrolase